MKSYSKDLRIRVLAAVDRGIPREEAARTFSVSVPTIKRWLKPQAASPDRGRGAKADLPGRPSRKGEMLRGWLPRQLQTKTPRPHAPRAAPRGVRGRARGGGLHLHRRKGHRPLARGRLWPIKKTHPWPPNATRRCGTRGDGWPPASMRDGWCSWTRADSTPRCDAPA